MYIKGSGRKLAGVNTLCQQLCSYFECVRTRTLGSTRQPAGLPSPLQVLGQSRSATSRRVRFPPPRAGQMTSKRAEEEEEGEEEEEEELHLFTQGSRCPSPGASSFGTSLADRLHQIKPDGRVWGLASAVSLPGFWPGTLPTLSTRPNARSHRCHGSIAPLCHRLRSLGYCTRASMSAAPTTQCVSHFFKVHQVAP